MSEQKITPCLWFDFKAEEAVAHYLSIFRNGRVLAGTWHHGSLTSPTVFTTRTGQVIALAPGRTWVEVYPAGSPVQISYVARKPARH